MENYHIQKTNCNECGSEVAGENVGSKTGSSSKARRRRVELPLQGGGGGFLCQRKGDTKRQNFVNKCIRENAAHKSARN